MQKTLFELAMERAGSLSEISKPDHYYKAYDRHFHEIRHFPLSIFEVGVYQCESTKIFSEYFSRSSILGIDIKLPGFEHDLYKNVTLAEGDQSDAAFLHGLADRHAPDGIDIVIEDASHVGDLSMKTFDALFPRVRSGGLYIVEDWGTGYWPHWADGEAWAPPVSEGDHIRSHDHGMVGFVKSLVDRVHPKHDGDQAFDVSEMHVYPGVVVLKKS